VTTWITITTQSGGSWISVTQAVDDWQNPLLTELLTESGSFLLAEDEDFLCIEAVASAPPSPWVPL
jgi:hypothetical protein